MSEEKRAWLDAKPKDYGNNQEIAQGGFRRGGRSTLEKVLIVVVVALVLALVAVVVFLIIAKIREKNILDRHAAVDNSRLCLSKGCVEAAARINSYIDYSIPYCDDFYQFSCGNWLKHNAVPEDKSSLDTFGLLRDYVDIILKNLLEEEDKPTDLGCMKKAKDYYRSCMNFDLINSRGDKPLKDFLIQEYGGWPLTTPDWSEDSFDFVQTILKLNNYSLRPVINMYIGTDQKNSSRNILKIDQTSFSLPGQKYYQVARNDTMLMAHEELIFQLGKLLGFADPSTARQEAADIVDFEILLANISVPDEKRRDSNALYNPMTLAEVHDNYSQAFDWQTYVHTMFSKPEIGVTGLRDDEIIINISPQYYQKLTAVLAATSKRTLANYLIWRLVRTLVVTLGDNYRSQLQVYRKVVFGASVEPARFRTCSGLAADTLGLAVGRLFIKDNFDADSRSIAQGMISGLQNSFNELLDHLDWMDEETKRVAKEKNEKITSKIGYPDEVTNDTYLEEYYTNFTYNKDQYFENSLLTLRESYYKNMRQLREVVDKKKWDSPPSTVNAFYNSLKNQIMFPAGILQPPFYCKNYPRSLNYGGIGVVIGHEVTHGFDDRGRQYDSNGNLVQWWSKSAVDKFKDKASCIVEQYGNFTVPEVNRKLNGINTQGENIADNGGLKQSFRAYRNWVEKQGKEEPLLPGLDFNHNQLFFINFAQLTVHLHIFNVCWTTPKCSSPLPSESSEELLPPQKHELQSIDEDLANGRMWCTLMTEESAINRIKTGVHSPGRFRVIGSVQNSPDFAEAFNCPLNSNMNPQRKCTVW